MAGSAHGSGKSMAACLGFAAVGGGYSAQLLGHHWGLGLTTTIGFATSAVFAVTLAPKVTSCAPSAPAREQGAAALASGETTESVLRRLVSLPELRLVSRLDAPTSGVLPLAYGEAAGRYLQAQFAGRLVRKDYLCLCEGPSLGERMLGTVRKFHGKVLELPIVRCDMPKGENFEKAPWTSMDHVLVLLWCPFPPLPFAFTRAGNRGSFAAIAKPLRTTGFDGANSRTEATDDDVETPTSFRWEDGVLFWILL
eukprot:Skav235363  [mRNA]  locus=scaffold3967:74276:79190:+ [translate_table: standard]